MFHHVRVSSSSFCMNNSSRTKNNEEECSFLVNRISLSVCMLTLWFKRLRSINFLSFLSFLSLSLCPLSSPSILPSSSSSIYHPPHFLLTSYPSSVLLILLILILLSPSFPPLTFHILLLLLHTLPLSSSTHPSHALSYPSFPFLILDHVWPPKWQDETEGYVESQLGREKEIMELTGSNERWENWMQYVQVTHIIWYYYALCNTKN